MAVSNWIDDFANIYGMDLDGSNKSLISTPGGSIDGIAVDAESGHLYFFDNTGNNLRRINVDGTGVTTVSNHGGVTADSLTLDTASQKVFFTDYSSDPTERIYSVNFDGTGSTLVFTGSHYITDVEIDSAASHIYFTSQINGDIHRINYDGTGLTTLVSGQTGLNGLALDPASGYLYWTDGTLIEKANLDGTGITTVLTNSANVTDIELKPYTGATTGTFGYTTTIASVPLSDDYDETRLKFVSATVAPDSVNEVTGVLTWNDIGSINAGATQTIEVTFEALEPTGNLPQAGIDNVATVTGAVMANGEAANDDTDTVTVTLNPTATIGDIVFSDIDGSGNYSAGDQGMPGVTVELLDAGLAVIATTVTDANGNYEFKGVRDGNYTVRIVQATLPTGFGVAYDPDGGVAHQAAFTVAGAAVTVPGGLNEGDFDFGYTVPNSFFGTVWQDYDNDGGTAEAGEGGIAGVTVQLLNSVGTVVATTTTNADGTYRIDNIVDGSYQVRILPGTLPVGATWAQTADPDATFDNQNSGLIAVAGGQFSGSHDFGYHASGTGSIGDKVFYDWNSDGVQDATDEGIDDVTVNLYADLDADGVYDPGEDPLVATTITGSDGSYNFNNLVDGDYIVQVDEGDADMPADVTAINTNPASVNLGVGETNKRRRLSLQSVRRCGDHRYCLVRLQR